MRKIIRTLLPLLLATSTLAVGDERAGTPDDWPPPMPDPGPFWMVQGDRLESTLGESENAYAWDIQGWYGYDRRRLRWKTEGEGEWGERAEAAEVQLLYSQLFSPYWEWQAGVRHDLRPGDGRSFAVVGLQGMAPYMFEVDASFYLSEDGDASFSFEAEYDLLLTQKLILQPRLELSSSFSNVAAYGTQRGDVDGEVGLRLRYEIRREFAPYLGLAHERSHDAGIGRSETVVLAGLHFWF